MHRRQREPPAAAGCSVLQTARATLVLFLLVGVACVCSMSGCQGRWGGGCWGSFVPGGFPVFIACPCGPQLLLCTAVYCCVQPGSFGTVLYSCLLVHRPVPVPSVYCWRRPAVRPLGLAFLDVLLCSSELRKILVSSLVRCWPSTAGRPAVVSCKGLNKQVCSSNRLLEQQHCCSSDKLLQQRRAVAQQPHQRPGSSSTMAAQQQGRVSHCCAT